MKPLTVVAAVLAAVPAWPLDAQTVAAGDKVRVTTRAGRLTATVLEVQPDALVVRTSAEGAASRIHLSGLGGLEVARGRRGHFGRGFLIGFVPGAALGAVAGAGLSCGDGSTRCNAAPDGALAGAVAGGAVTGLLGGLIGHAVRTDRWVRVPTASGAGPRLRVGVAALPGGVAARLRVSF